MLIDEIISILSDSNGKLTDALLKTKVLLHDIGRKELATWVTNELRGYPEDGDVPDYRIVGSEPHGHIMNMRMQMRDYRLPILHLKSADQERLTSFPCTIAIEAIERAVQDVRGKKGKWIRPLPPEIGPRIAKALTAGTHVVSAWCEISLVDLAGILSEVRSRLLDFALELRDAAGRAPTNEAFAEKASHLDTPKIFSATILGGTNTLVLGSAGAQTVNVSNDAGDFESLATVIRALGYSDSDVSALKAAVLEDQSGGKQPRVDEGKTSHWFSQALKKAGKGLVKGGVDVTAAVIVKALEAYTKGVTG